MTNGFGDYLDTSTIDSALAGVAELKRIVKSSSSSGIRIRVAIGEAKTKLELALVPRMIKEFGDLANICVNIRADEHGVVDGEMYVQAKRYVVQSVCCNCNLVTFRFCVLTSVLTGSDRS